MFKQATHIKKTSHTSVNEIPSTLQEIQSLTELQGFEAPTAIQDIPKSMTPQQSSSFYPPMNDISGNSDLLKDKPAYAWDAQTIDTKPKVQYDIQSEVEEKVP